MLGPGSLRDRTFVTLALVAACAIVAFWITAGVSEYFSDYPFIYMVRDEWSNNLVRSWARFPGITEAALHLVAGVLVVPAIVCAVWAAARLGVDPLEVAARFAKKPGKAAAALAAMAALGGAAIAFLVIRQVFLIDDERAYVFQAELFAQGKALLPEVPSAFRNPMFLLSPWMGKYPPGQSLALLPGALLGVPHLVPPLLGGALVFATYGFVREAFDERQALLAAALLAVSPFVWCMSGTVMSFPAAALGLMVAFWMFARGQREGAAVSFLLAGAGLGLTLIVRPFDAVTTAIPMGVWLLIDMTRPTARSRFGIVPFALGALPFVAGLLFYNWITLGDPLSFGYVRAGDFSFGFYTQSVPGHPYVHTPSQGLAMLGVSLIRLDLWLFGWPGALLLVLPGAVLARTSWDTFVVATVLTYVFTHTIVPAGTWDVGPTYSFPLAPLLVVLAVRALHALRLAAPAGSPWRRAVGWFPVAGACIAFVTILPIRLLRLSAVSTEIEKPWKAIAEAGIGDAIVVLPSAGEMAAAAYALGYPYTVESGPGTAHLIRPYSVPELEQARRALGEKLPVYVLMLDRQAFRELGIRRYALERRG